MNQSSIATATAHIDLPREKAWEILRDLSVAHHYVPGVIKTEISTEQKEGIGVNRKVFQSETKAIDETVEEWNEGYGFSICLHRGNAGPPFPFREAHFYYAINGEGNDTVLTTSLVYVTRWGGFGRLLDRLLLNRLIEGRIKDIALCLKTYYETGQPVTPQILRQMKATRGN